MSKQEYDIIFEYIHNILENEECTINDILVRNIKKKYLLPDAFFKLFNICTVNKQVIDSEYFK